MNQYVVVVSTEPEDKQVGLAAYNIEAKSERHAKVSVFLLTGRRPLFVNEAEPVKPRPVTAGRATRYRIDLTEDEAAFIEEVIEAADILPDGSIDRTGLAQDILDKLSLVRISVAA